MKANNINSIPKKKEIKNSNILYPQYKSLSPVKKNHYQKIHWLRLFKLYIWLPSSPKTLVNVKGTH